MKKILQIGTIVKLTNCDKDNDLYGVISGYNGCGYKVVVYNRYNIIETCWENLLEDKHFEVYKKIKIPKNKIG